MTTLQELQLKLNEANARLALARQQRNEAHDLVIELNVINGRLREQIASLQSVQPLPETPQADQVEDAKA